MRKAWLVWVGLWACTTCAWAKPAQVTHQSWFHLAPKSRIFSSQELIFLKKFKGWFKRHHLRAPRYDVGLREAAWHLAQRMARFKGRRLTHQSVRAAMWLGGRSDQRVRIFGQGYTQPKALWKALFRSLSRTLAGQRPNFHGFAIAGGKHKVCILLLVRRGAAIAPMARWRYVGQELVIRGRLLARFRSPSIMLGMAGGRVVRPKVKKLSGGRFSAKWRIDRPGEIRVQVLVRDDEGPWLSAQCTSLAVSLAHGPKQILRKLWREHRAKLTAAPVKMVWMSQKQSSPKKKWTAASAAKALLQRVNALRKRHKLPRLRRQHRLMKLALGHAKDMVQHHFFAHTSPQKGSFLERFKRLGWKVKQARENIVAATTPAEAFRLLFQSPVHRANLYLRRATLTGVGAAINAKGIIYFTQVFVTP